jgi:LemA protein
MSKALVGIGVVLGVIVLGALIFVGVFISIGNGLIAKEESVNAAWANVESKLQRRFDLIPNLVETVKGYAKQEADVLEKVTALRSQWGAAKTVDEKAAAAGQLEGFLGRLMVISENYPELKSNANFMELQAELAGTENRISVERDRYNESVKEFNTAIRSFPASLIAGMKGMTPKESFKAEAGAETAPKVKFGE